MKRARYLVFAGSLFYPEGGADDLIARISKIDYAEIAKIIKSECIHGFDWIHVYDSEKGKIVLRHTSGNSYYEEITGTHSINFKKILDNL